MSTHGVVYILLSVSGFGTTLFVAAAVLSVSSSTGNFGTLLYRPTQQKLMQIGHSRPAQSAYWKDDIIMLNFKTNFYSMGNGKFNIRLTKKSQHGSACILGYMPQSKSVFVIYIAITARVDTCAVPWAFETLKTGKSFNALLIHP